MHPRNPCPVALALAATFVTISAGAARAADGPISLSGGIGVASDYVFRGISQTDGAPQAFASVEVTLGAEGYAGVWASNVDFGDGTDMEVDLYAGLRPRLGAISFDVGLIYYGYAGQPKAADRDYWELKAGASSSLGPATFGAVAYYSPDFTGAAGEAWYYEASVSVGVPGTDAVVSAAVGHRSIADAADYATWNLGVGLPLTDQIAIDLRYFDTDASKLGSAQDARVAASLKLTF